MLQIAPMSKNWTFECNLSGIVTGMNPSTQPRIIGTMLLPQGKEMRLQLKSGVDNHCLFGGSHLPDQKYLCYYELVINDRVDYPIKVSIALECSSNGGFKYFELSRDLSDAKRGSIKIQPGNPLPIVGLVDHSSQGNGRSRSAKFKLILTIHFPQPLNDDAEVFVSDQISKLRNHAEQIVSLLAEGKFAAKDCKVVTKDGNVHDFQFLLCLKSDVFQKAFETGSMSEAKLNQIQIDADSDIVDLLIPYLYAGKMPKITIESAMPLYRLAHMYQIEGLRAYLAEEIMLKANQLVKVSNVLEMVVFTENFDLKVFKQFCLEFINGNRSDVVNLAEWEEFHSAHFNLVKQLLLL